MDVNQFKNVSYYRTKLQKVDFIKCTVEIQMATLVQLLPIDSCLDVVVFIYAKSSCTV